MNCEKIKYEDLIAKFDYYEENFEKYGSDEVLANLFHNFEDNIIASKFSNDQLLNIKVRLDKLMEILFIKKEELKRESVELLERQHQIGRYIANFNLGK